MSFTHKKFRTVQFPENGETSGETIFEYLQKDNILTSEYKGGQIVKGHLLGMVDKEGNIGVRYHQVNFKGELPTGVCNSIPLILSNGEIRLYENWKWTSGNKSSRKSVI